MDVQVKHRRLKAVAQEAVGDGELSLPHDLRRLRPFPRDVREWESVVPEIKELPGGGQSLEMFGFQIMQSWEAPLMKAMAESVCSVGDNVLEIGYGLGICTSELQKNNPRLHVIVECNRSLATWARTHWADNINKCSIVVIQGFWDEVCAHGDLSETLLLKKFGANGFDGIVFDTFPFSAEELRRNHFAFFATANRLLVPGGKLTYFSDEYSTMSGVHQRKVREAMPGCEITHRQVRVSPPPSCEYWSSPEILHVVVTKG
jgi:guanidinoacetate N-methyltransferase